MIRKAGNMYVVSDSKNHYIGTYASYKEALSVLQFKNKIIKDQKIKKV
jgi:hypothetical protein